MNAQVAPADGRALPVLSPAVQAAQERLRELRRHFGVTSDERRPTADDMGALHFLECDAPSQADGAFSDEAAPKGRRTSESATPPERTHRERWAEIARRGLFSQPLAEHLRRVTSDERRTTNQELSLIHI